MNCRSRRWNFWRRNESSYIDGFGSFLRDYRLNEIGESTGRGYTSGLFFIHME